MAPKLLLFTSCLALLAVHFGRTALVGGWSDGAVDDQRVKEAADYAVDHINKKSNALYAQTLVEIVKVQQQVVAGVKYKITLKLAYTTCRKTGVPAAQTCDEDKNQARELCEVVVWVQSWKNFKEVESFSCSQESMKKRSVKNMIGGGDHDKLRGLFQEFMRKYNKQYANEREHAKRFLVFRDNMKKIRQLQKMEQGTAVYGATAFADLTRKEFQAYHLGLKLKLAKTDFMGQASIPSTATPTAFDWRDHGAVTPVKNQEQCGSCWAFSVTGNVEGQWAINQGKLLSLSEQELVDCDTLDEGCNGGYMTNAYESIIELGGLETEAEYPYDAEDEKCKFDKTEAKVNIHSYVNISSDEKEMAQWLTKNGPISIGINANAMQFYFGGVSHPFKFLCSPDNLDHGVLIVGYGESKYPLFNKTLPYWIVKNSWGKSWGEKGYYRVFRGDGTCGLNLMASSAVV